MSEMADVLEQQIAAALAEMATSSRSWQNATAKRVMAVLRAASPDVLAAALGMERCGSRCVLHGELTSAIQDGANNVPVFRFRDDRSGQ